MEAFDVDITAASSLFWFAFTPDLALNLCQSNDGCTMCFSSINIRSCGSRTIREGASTILAEDALNTKVFALRIFWAGIPNTRRGETTESKSEMDHLPPYRACEFV